MNDQPTHDYDIAGIVIDDDDDDDIYIDTLYKEVDAIQAAKNAKPIITAVPPKEIVDTKPTTTPILTDVPPKEIVDTKPTKRKFMEVPLVAIHDGEPVEISENGSIKPTLNTLAIQNDEEDDDLFIYDTTLSSLPTKKVKLAETDNDTMIHIIPNSQLEHLTFQSNNLDKTDTKKKDVRANIIIPRVEIFNKFCSSFQSYYSDIKYDDYKILIHVTPMLVYKKSDFAELANSMINFTVPVRLQLYALVQKNAKIPLIMNFNYPAFFTCPDVTDNETFTKLFKPFPKHPCTFYICLESEEFFTSINALSRAYFTQSNIFMNSVKYNSITHNDAQNYIQNAQRMLDSKNYIMLHWKLSRNPYYGYKNKRRIIFSIPHSSGHQSNILLQFDSTITAALNPTFIKRKLFGDSDTFNINTVALAQANCCDNSINSILCEVNNYNSISTQLIQNSPTKIKIDIPLKTILAVISFCNDEKKKFNNFNDRGANGKTSSNSADTYLYIDDVNNEDLHLFTKTPNDVCRYWLIRDCVEVIGKRPKKCWKINLPMFFSFCQDLMVGRSTTDNVMCEIHFEPCNHDNSHCGHAANMNINETCMNITIIRIYSNIPGKLNYTPKYSEKQRLSAINEVYSVSANDDVDLIDDNQTDHDIAQEEYIKDLGMAQHNQPMLFEIKIYTSMVFYKEPVSATEESEYRELQTYLNDNIKHDYICETSQSFSF